MKLFDNLRKRIVQKLIRPEDGYTDISFIGGEPVQFHYEEHADQYLLYTKYDNGSYFVPTLTGWREYLSKHQSREIPFHRWVYGILENICDEYFARLEDLSHKDLKSLRDYMNPESGEKIVITKKSFCDIMKALDSYWTNLRALEDILNVYFERGMMVDIIDKVVDALEEELEPQFYDPELDFNIDENPLIMQWLTGLESERTVNGRLLTTAEDLYDYLVEKRDEISGKKVSETP